MAGVHGDERCGVEAFRSLLPKLKIQRGSVAFVMGNPRAIDEVRHFVEADLNRMFQDQSALSEQDKASYEYARAQVIKKSLDRSGALLDIHASSIPGSPAFAICEKNAGDIVPYLPVDLVVSGFDAVEPGGTDYYMNRNDRIGICVECGYLGDKKSTDIAKESIIAFLKARGHLDTDISPQQQRYLRMYRKYFTSTDSFTLAKPFENFECVARGQRIGTDGSEPITADRDSQILFAKNSTVAGYGAFLLGEKTDTLV